MFALLIVANIFLILIKISFLVSQTLINLFNTLSLKFCNLPISSSSSSSSSLVHGSFSLVHGSFSLLHASSILVQGSTYFLAIRLSVLVQKSTYFLTIRSSVLVQASTIRLSFIVQAALFFHDALLVFILVLKFACALILLLLKL